MIWVALIIVVTTLFYLCFLSVVLWGILRAKRNIQNSMSDVKISVIIPFRDEAEHIERIVTSLLEMNLSKDKYEIILVDDNSQDDSVKRLQKYLSKNVKLLKNKNNLSFGYKKQAITQAIDEAEGEIIFLTDADCIPNKNWVKAMMNLFSPEIGMVVGPVKFIEGNNLFSKLQQLEFAGLMLTAAGLIKSGFATICSSANLAFQKKVFYEVGGYGDNLNLSSGDDELLMQKIRAMTKHKIEFCWSKSALVETNGNKNILDFMQQRRRWASKSLFYKNKLLVLSLMLIFTYYLLLLIFPVLLIIDYNFFFWLFVFSAGIKLFMEFTIMLQGRKLFFTNKNLRFFFIAEILHVPYIVFAAILGSFGNYVWKNRKVKR
ncbi:MAG: glycosyltransferase [Ignavibacteriales bacterium]